MKSAGMKFIDGTVVTSVYDLNPIGTIVTSILNIDNFTGQTGDSWVLADGRNVSGSKYATVTGNNTIPDLRGVFLRGHDPSNVHDPDTRTVGSLQSDEFRSHTHSINNADLVRRNVSGSPNFAPGTGGFSPTATLTNNNSGGAETRPVNVAVNYFVKIN